MLFAQIATKLRCLRPIIPAIRAKSIGAEAPPTKDFGAARTSHPTAART
ncbi:DUF6053 domain-containing protein [Lysobacter sp. 2RAB21]